MQTPLSRRLATIFTLLFLLLPTTSRAATPELAGDPAFVGEDSNQPRAFYGAERFGIARVWRQPVQFPERSAMVNQVEYNTYPVSFLSRTDGGSPVAINSCAAAATDDYTLLVYATGVPSTYYLNATLIDAEGNELSDVILDTSSSADESFLSPAVTSNPQTGTFFVVWHSFDTGGSWPLNLRGMIVDPAGGVITPGTPIDYVTGGITGAPDVTFAVYPFGSFPRFVMTWRNEAVGLGTIYVLDVDATSGLPSDAVTSLPWAASSSPKIASDGEQCILVADAFGTVYGQRLTALASAIGVAIEIGEGNAPDIGATESEYLVAWWNQTSLNQIDGRCVGFTGGMTDPEFLIASGSTTHRYPSVAGNADSWIVAYERLNGATYGTADIYYQRVGSPAFTFLDSDVNETDPSSTRGVAWGDWIASPFPDDRPDLYVANTGNEPNEQFANGNPQLLLWSVNTEDTRNGQGVAFADYDNDDDLDLFVSNASQADELWRNDGGTYTAQGPTAGVAGTQNARSVAWGDIDSDGNLDLAVACKSTFNNLYVQSTPGTFATVSVRLGVDALNTEGIAFVDFDLDNDLDLYVGNAGSTNRLYINDGTGFFTEDAASYGLDDAGSARSVSWADMDRDGDPDCFVSKYNEPNTLYRNDRHGGFVDVTLQAFGPDAARRSESACWADADLDGDMDLFIANYTDPDRFWRNDGGGTFSEIGASMGLASSGPSLGAAWADADGDGDPDLCIGEYGGMNRVFLNDFTPSGNHWIQVRLEGTISNASAIGAKVTMTIGNKTFTQWVGLGGAYLSQNDFTVTFGLGAGLEADAIDILWPSGLTDSYSNVAADQRYTYVENDPTGVVSIGAGPTLFGLEPARPNPFRGSTELSFELPRAGQTELVVYDVNGRRVADLGGRRPLTAGRHTLTWDGRDTRGRAVASGVYFVRLSGETETAVQRVVLRK